MSFNLSGPLKFKLFEFFFQNPSATNNGLKCAICRERVFQCNKEKQREKKCLNVLYKHFQHFQSQVSKSRVHLIIQLSQPDVQKCREMTVFLQESSCGCSLCIYLVTKTRVKGYFSVFTFDSGSADLCNVKDKLRQRPDFYFLPIKQF